MFSTVNYFQTCKPGRVNLTVVLNTDYCQTLVAKYLHLQAVCGHNHPTMIKIHSFLIPQKPKQSQLSSHFDFGVNNQRSLPPSIP